MEYINQSYNLTIIKAYNCYNQNYMIKKEIKGKHKIRTVSLI